MTYRALATPESASAESIRDLVLTASNQLQADPAVRRIKWKRRQHDVAPGLHHALLEAGFEVGESESVLALAINPDADHRDGRRTGTTIHRAETEAEVIAAEHVAGVIFGDSPAQTRAAHEVLLAQFHEGNLQMWYATCGQEVVCSGRLELVPQSDFAGLWGGATLPDYRHHGIYRALTTARLREAAALGKSWVYSESNEQSRPILQRSGFEHLTTNRAYRWERESGH